MQATPRYTVPVMAPRTAPAATLTAPAPLEMPTTEQTISALRQRLARELYQVDLDLKAGARIAGLPCDCLTKGKHLGGLEAAAEELMSYEVNPVYGQIIEWVNRHAPEFEPSEIVKKEPAYFQSMAPEVRAFRKAVLGTEELSTMLTDNPAQGGGET